MRNTSSSPELTNCLFTNNNATTNEGGLINLTSSSPSLINCTFNSNNCSNNGGATLNFSSSNPTIVNTVFYKSTASNSGNTIYNNSSSLNANSTNNATDADTGLFTSPIYLSSIYYNQLFVDSIDLDGTDNQWSTADDGLLILPSSFLYSAGDTTGAPSEDITGFARPNPPSIGAYEAYPTCNANYGTIYVDVNANGNNSGFNWANAYTDLQDALDLRMCAGVDTILVSEGKYYPSQSPDGTTTNARYQAFHLADSNVVIIGGYDAIVGTQTGDTTFLDGDIGTLDTTSDNVFHVLVTVGLDSSTSLNNLTINKGNANGGNTSISYSGGKINQKNGGGMYIHDFSSPIIANCSFTSNSALRGGGMYNTNSSSPSL